MDEKKSYPEEIYCKDYVIGEMLAAERAYDLGLRDGAKPTDPLAGFSNLTNAIQGGIKIDWEKLDGLVAKCVHPEMGTLTKKLVRNCNWDIDGVMAWYERYDTMFGIILGMSWRGTDNWSLWIEGEIPIKKRMASELPMLTHFKGAYDGDLYECIIYGLEKHETYLVMAVGGDGCLTSLPPDSVEVVEVYGG